MKSAHNLAQVCTQDKNKAKMDTKNKKKYYRWNWSGNNFCYLFLLFSEYFLCSWFRCHCNFTIFEEMELQNAPQCAIIYSISFIHEFFYFYFFFTDLLSLLLLATCFVLFNSCHKRISFAYVWWIVEVMKNKEIEFCRKLSVKNRFLKNFWEPSMRIQTFHPFSIYRHFKQFQQNIYEKIKQYYC